MTRAESQAQTREDLLAAAARAFSRRGYERASVAEIADDAGYSHGAVYSNFEGKEDLFLALYERWVAQRVEAIDLAWTEAGTLAERARAAADEWLQRLADDPAPFLLRLELTVRAVYDHSLRKELATRVGAVPLAIARVMEGADEGPAASALPLPPEEVATAFQALSLGLALETLANPDAVRPGLGGDLATLLTRALEEAGKR
ncbi:MAG TPA: TetR/AcrR family transcriptional regulator [Solirubrobacteraceae bacterium]